MASLLALDRPVRRGVRYDATELIGRDSDLDRLRALMASSRVVSIVGPGGLGKTRLAHALARDAAQPVVHVVELVGVTSAEDLTGPYDVIVRAEARSIDDLGRMVVSQIQLTQGITRTVTCPVLNL